MKALLPALAAALALSLACGSSSNKNNVSLTATVARTPLAGGTAVPTTLLGTRPPNATPRPSPAAARASASPAAASSLPTVPPGTPDLTTLPDGLKYQDITVGSGAQPTSGQKVTVNYTGWLENGTKFDSSLDRNMPFTFTLGQGQVIKGWDEGVAPMKMGGKRRLVIPAALAYGASGRPPTIPPNATLIFDIDLLSAQ
jgi:peptidylprolyl isomerase